MTPRSALLSCGFFIFIAILLSTPLKDFSVRRLCEEKGVLRPAQEVIISGYVRPKDSSMEYGDLYFAALDLVGRGFEFLEFESVPNWYKFPKGTTEEQANLARKTMHVRISVRTAPHPDCLTFNRELAGNADRLRNLREKGLTEGECVAISLVSDLQSRVERRVVRTDEWGFFTGFIYATQHGYFDRATNVPLIELWAFDGSGSGNSERKLAMVPTTYPARCWNYSAYKEMDRLVRGPRARIAQ